MGKKLSVNRVREYMRIVEPGPKPGLMTTVVVNVGKNEGLAFIDGRKGTETVRLSRGEVVKFRRLGQGLEFGRGQLRDAYAELEEIDDMFGLPPEA